MNNSTRTLRRFSVTILRNDFYAYKTKRKDELTRSTPHFVQQ